jgi:hypothetical protein
MKSNPPLQLVLLLLHIYWLFRLSLAENAFIFGLPYIFLPDDEKALA